MVQACSHYRAALVALAAAAALAGAAGPAGAQSADTSKLIVYINGTRLGEVDSTVERTADGWMVSSTGRLSPPLDLVTRRLAIRYGADWTPLGLEIEAVSRGLPLTMRTTVTGSSATTDVTQQGQTIPKTDTVSARTLLLPNLFFASFEALALQLSSMAGDSTRYAAYIVPQAEIQVNAQRAGEETIETPERAVRSRRFTVTFANPGTPLVTDVWIDERGRLLRFGAVAQGLVVVREDIASVGARRQNISRAGDETVQIPTNGCTLVGTFSKPSGEPDAKGRHPAVIMVGGSGLTDRDETVAGIPIFGQIAGALADAGMAVVRYDKRGVGQSGCRAESATLTEYADDVVAVFRFLDKRKDVDDRRVAVFGHSEGAMVALLAATRQKDIAALVLAGAPSGTGAELVLEQQQSVLAQSKLTDEEKNARVELQRRVQAAVLGAGDWTGIPEDLRKQADTPWFRSFLAFDPVRPLEDLRQPILILQGDRDTQVLPHHAARLAERARARKGRDPERVRVVELKGVNHLLVPAETGQVAEYARLAGRSVTPDVPSATVAFLREKMKPR